MKTNPEYSTQTVSEDEVIGIIQREKGGFTCTEEESATIKRYLKESWQSTAKNYNQELIEEIQFYLPCEYGEAIAEAEEFEF